MPVEVKSGSIITPMTNSQKSGDEDEGQDFEML
jgi:hypothetical protein